MTHAPEPTPNLPSLARQRVLHVLKRCDTATAADVAEALEMTDVAARQHLTALEAVGLVTATTQTPQGRGRPAIHWSLTAEAASTFPDRHGELTVGLIQAVRQAVGEEGLLRVIDVRSKDQVADYRARMPAPSASLRRRVEALAEIRTEEGYMAEVRPHGRGVYLLIEHHCPICEAARSCVGLCQAELEVFQHVLGAEVQVERTEHLLDEGQRCVYRVQRRP